MNIVPMHLKEFACNMHSKKDSTVFYLKCICGNEIFTVTSGKTKEAKKAEEQWDKYWKKFRLLPIFSFGDAVDRKKGQRYIYGNTFFGIRVGKLYDEDLHSVKDLCVIKATCSSCFKEIVVFDNRRHGYDAQTDIWDAGELGTVNPSFADESALKFHDTCRGNACAIKVSVQNNLSFNDFYETFGYSASEKDYSNAFSRIKITSIVDGKSRTILDMETS